MTMLLAHLKGIIGVDRRGMAHAMDWFPKRKVNQYGYRAACGAMVRMATVPCKVESHDGATRMDHRTLAWPPRVKEWAEFGEGGRCRDCMTATGNPRPEPLLEHLEDVPA